MGNKFNDFKNIQNKRVAKSISNIEKLAPIVSKWEAGYVNDPTDKGGATNMGITIATWKLMGYDKNGDGIITNADIKLLDSNDFSKILRKYWDKWQADKINNQSIANILVDWYWGSGKWGIVIPQRDLLNIESDGSVGDQTLSVLNDLIEKDAKGTFEKIFSLRVKFFNDIVDNSIKTYEKKIGRKATGKELQKYTQKRFINGWINRLNDFKYS